MANLGLYTQRLIESGGHSLFLLSLGMGLQKGLSITESTNLLNTVKDYFWDSYFIHPYFKQRPALRWSPMTV